MKNTLFFGSTVTDVIINVDELPGPGEDSNVISQKMQLGGCAFNASEISRQLAVPYRLLSPVGSGVFGDFVAAEFGKRGISIFKRLPDIPNGCCYCVVERNGERTFLSAHGAEYLFDESWMSAIPENDADVAYVCGLELEEDTGPYMVKWLEEHFRGEVFFAVSSRIMHVNRDILRRMFLLKPVLHLNDMEARMLSSQGSVEDAARWLYEHTGNVVIITCNQDGCYVYGKNLGDPEKDRDENGEAYGVMVEAYKTIAIDSIGAGDSHVGTVIALRKQGLSWLQAVDRANLVASKVVGVEGATLTDDQFRSITL